jgi:poly(3-hydroxybutyrate) depolymerase
LKHKRLYILLGSIVILLGASVLGFVLWAESTNPVMPTAIEALKSDAQVKVEEKHWIVFEPVENKSSVGLIFYPGGKVEARAYAPIMRAIAAEGYFVVIAPMPLNLAIFGIERATQVMDAHPDITTWVLGGHSLGGAMASNYTYKYPERVDGLILYASYPAESNSLADSNLPVISIYGTQDGRVDDLIASSPLLPAATTYVVIEGGNHAQFGDYGLQHGDGEAMISREEQQGRAIAAT